MENCITNISTSTDNFCICCKTINDFINEMYFVILEMINEKNIKADIISLDVNIWTEICLLATKNWLNNVNNIDEKRNSSSLMNNDYFSNLLANLHNSEEENRELLQKNYGYMFVELTKTNWFELFFTNIIVTL